MKNFLFVLILTSTLFLTGCFETTQEITIKEDGTGTFIEKTDMSAVMGLIKMAGEESKELKELKDKAIDTTVFLGSLVDSIPSLSPQEKAVYKKATIALTMNMEDEKFVFSLNSPFTAITDLNTLKEGSIKLMSLAMQKSKDMAEGADNPLAGGMPPSPTTSYFKQTFSPGLIAYTLDKEKYAGIASDSLVQSMKQMVDMGMAPTYKTIFHLPHPAKTVTGKKATLSADKKDITVEISLADIYEHAADCEYKIEY